MKRQTLILALLLYVSGLCPAYADAATSGKALFEKHCSHCHAPGYEHPGTRQLGLSRGKDKAVLVERHDLSGEYINYVVSNGLMAMPAFLPTDITDAQMQELINYLLK